jgi:hypothetical protein
MGHKLRSGALEAPGPDRWFVTDGVNAVGPVRLDLLARGVATGRVPPDTFVRHDTWKVWRPLADFVDVGDPSLQGALPPAPLSDVFAEMPGDDEAPAAPALSDEATMDADAFLEAIPHAEAERLHRFTAEASRAEASGDTASGVESSQVIERRVVDEVRAADDARDTTDSPASAARAMGPGYGTSPFAVTGESPQTALAPPAVPPSAEAPRPRSTTLTSSPNPSPSALPASVPPPLPIAVTTRERPGLDTYDDDDETQVPSKPLTAFARNPSSLPANAPASAPPASGPFPSGGPVSSGRAAGTSSVLPRLPSIPAPPPVPQRRATLVPKTDSQLPRPAVRPLDDALANVPGWPSARLPEARSAIVPGDQASSPTPVSLGAPPAIAPSHEVFDAARTTDELPRADLDTARDLSEAMLLLLGGVVKKTHAEAAALHRMADDGATVLCAHGPNMVEVLGTRTRLLDPTVVAAAGGHVVISEPTPGPAGEATLVRMRRLGVDADAAVMFPLRPNGRLLGLLEVGRRDRFSLADILSAERLIAAFVARAESQGWTA